MFDGEMVKKKFHLKNFGLRKFLVQDKVGLRTFLVQIKLDLEHFHHISFLAKSLKCHV